MSTPTIDRGTKKPTLALICISGGLMNPYLVLVHNHLSGRMEHFAVMAADSSAAALEVAQVLMEQQRTSDLVVAVLTEGDVDGMKALLTHLQKN